MDSGVTGASLLQGDAAFFNKVLSRDTSKGFSSHVYVREANGVPFKWETQPGTPIHPHVNGSIPPLSPPPVANGSFKTPSFSSIRIKDASPRSTNWFWKRSKKLGQSKNDEKFESWTSDAESACSPRDSNCSSYSGSFSSFEGSSSPSSKTSSPRRGKKGKIACIGFPLRCTPRSFGRVMVFMCRKH